MIKALIVEDEFNARRALRKILEQLMPSIKIIKEASGVTEALSMIEAENPDIVFLDIELGDGTGFDILEQLKAINFKLIFTTAYNQYAIKAFKFSALDYLMKPIDPYELKATLEKTIATIHEENEYKKLLGTLKANLIKKEQTIILKTTEQTFVVKVSDIIRLEGQGAYTTFVTASKSIFISKNLKYYQSLLDDTFIRCHQSHLVNKNHVKGMLKSEFLQMSNDNLVPVSSRKKAEVNKFITS